MLGQLKRTIFYFFFKTPEEKSIIREGHDFFWDFLKDAMRVGADVNAYKKKFL